MTMIATNDPIEALDRMAAEGYDIYDAAVTIGMADEMDMTTRRWRQGDLALRVEKAYGEHIIARFATALNINTNTLKQRRTMADFYKKDTRVSYENVGYAHFREAMKLGTPDKATWALEKAHTKDWPVWKFALIVNRYLGKPTRAQAITGVIHSLLSGDGQRGSFDHMLIELDEITTWQPGAKVIVRLAK